MSEKLEPILIGGVWRDSCSGAYFQASDPKAKQKLPARYPVSPWLEVEEALRAARRAFDGLCGLSSERRAQFLERLADRIEARRVEIVELAQRETALPREPRLNTAELPRTTSQIRQAAAAAREGFWTLPTIDAKNNVRSMYRPLGPVCVFGPNNFPLAFNSVAGGDFAAAIAAGNPVLAKANTSHPGTTRLLAEEAFRASEETEMPPASVQLLYRTSHEDGKRMVSHALVGATAYTGSRPAGLALKEAADRAGKPIYLELSSINPVVVLPGALEERADAIAGEFQASCLMGTGQFCTNPGLVLLLDSAPARQWIDTVKARFEAAQVGTLLGEGVQNALLQSIQALEQAGAEVVTGGQAGGGEGYCVHNTVLRVSGSKFLANAEALQQEAFGNASLFVLAESVAQLQEILSHLEGNLTGCVYSHRGGRDEALYRTVTPLLQERVGRLLNDKMPTGVLVTPAMNHGGPFPATGHPGFTAVGIPASLRRFAMLQCFDNVRHDRLPLELQNKNPTGRLWRSVDEEWTQRDL
ncbi:MAG: aldehyde dehydrogenase (NADP(+)) [Planctomycetes bacterium]|nr:aldehyde dehydrogenase (NADP(+)) [Planctomycetota bacterium]